MITLINKSKNFQIFSQKMQKTLKKFQQFQKISKILKTFKNSIQPPNCQANFTSTLHHIENSAQKTSQRRFEKQQQQQRHIQKKQAKKWEFIEGGGKKNFLWSFIYLILMFMCSDAARLSMMRCTHTYFFMYSI